MIRSSRWICAAFVSLWAGTAAAGPLSTGLLGEWLFNGNGLDASGNGNTLVLTGHATYGTGLSGQGLALDGTQGSAAVMQTLNPVFGFGAGDFTVQIWAKFVSTGSEQVLIEQFTGGSGPGWTLTTPGNLIQFYSGGAILNAPTTLQAGVWQEFVVTRAGSTLSLYYDDTLVQTASTSGTLASTTTPLQIGARNAADGRNFTTNGVIDNVAIWDRALTADEVAATWNGGAGVEVAAAAPVDTPEPASVALLGVGVLGLWRRRVGRN